MKAETESRNVDNSQRRRRTVAIVEKSIIILLCVAIVVVVRIILFHLLFLLTPSLGTHEKEFIWEGTQVVESYGKGDGQRYVYPCQFSRCDPTERQHWQTEIYEGVWEPSVWFDDPNIIRLCYALLSYDFNKVEGLIKYNGVDINARGKEGMTLLMWSIFCEFNQIELLLQNGASPDFIVESNYRILIAGYGESSNWIENKSFLATLTYLSYYEVEESTHRFRDLVKLMLKYGADPNYNRSRSLILTSQCFHTNDQYSQIRQLIASGYDVQRGVGTVASFDPPVDSREDEEKSPYILNSGYFCDLNTRVGLALHSQVKDALKCGVPSIRRNLEYTQELLQRAPNDASLKHQEDFWLTRRDESFSSVRQYERVLSRQGVSFDGSTIQEAPSE